MREMHKWKDKVEFALDNRQIFFLFFGLSVVGCFVFALGVMTGRRVTWEPEGAEASAVAENSLELLDEDSEPTFSFQHGLAESQADALPETRDPSVPPRDKKTIEAEKREKSALAAAAIRAADEQADREQKSPAPKAAAPTAAAPKAAAPKAAPAPKEPAPAEDGAKRIFTLQMKAFSRADEAESFADKLRGNGHDIRVEAATVRGREWHRVRLGRFDDWNKALEAKNEFEKSEHVIAYVVAL